MGESHAISVSELRRECIDFFYNLIFYKCINNNTNRNERFILLLYISVLCYVWGGRGDRAYTNTPDETYSYIHEYTYKYTDSTHMNHNFTSLEYFR